MGRHIYCVYQVCRPDTNPFWQCIANYGSENSEYQIVLNSDLYNKKAKLWVIDETFTGRPYKKGEM